MLYDKRAVRDSSVTVTCSGICWKTSFCILNFFLKIILFVKLYQTLKQCFITTSITSNFVKNAPLCVVFFLSVWYVMEHSVSCCHITLNPRSPKSVKQQPIRYRLILARAWPTSANTGIAPKSDILIGLCLTHWALGRHLLFGLSLAGGSSFSVW